MFSSFLVWAAAHPDAVVGGIVSFVSFVMALVKLFMTPEKYAVLEPRVAGVMKIFGGFFPDLVKVTRGFKQVVGGKSDVEVRIPLDDVEIVEEKK